MKQPAAPTRAAPQPPRNSENWEENPVLARTLKGTRSAPTKAEMEASSDHAHVGPSPASSKASSGSQVRRSKSTTNLKAMKTKTGVPRRRGARKSIVAAMSKVGGVLKGFGKKKGKQSEDDRGAVGDQKDVHQLDRRCKWYRRGSGVHGMEAMARAAAAAGAAEATGVPQQDVVSTAMNLLTLSQSESYRLNHDQKQDGSGGGSSGSGGRWQRGSGTGGSGGRGGSGGPQHKLTASARALLRQHFVAAPGAGDISDRSLAQLIPPPPPLSSRPSRRGGLMQTGEPKRNLSSSTRALLSRM